MTPLLDIGPPQPVSKRKPKLGGGPTATERETAACTVAGRLRIPIEEARQVVAAYQPRGLFATLAWELRCAVSLPELEALHREVTR